MIAHIKRRLAIRKLARMVEQRRNSFEVERYRRNRAAQLKNRPRRVAA